MSRTVRINRLEMSCVYPRNNMQLILLLRVGTGDIDAFFQAPRFSPLL
jgi:hypothetical protein